MRSGTKRAEEQIRHYVEAEAHEAVVHLELAASELVGPVRHEIWDVHGTASRWWVVTNPTNLYTQEDFKSRDVALTFHIGLALRMSYLQERQVPVTPDSATLLPGSWRRWEQAAEAFESNDEAETFQSVGMRLRECLVSFLSETTNPDLIPDGVEEPKAADFRGWVEHLANHLTAGKSSAKLRSYLKKMAVETWEYVNWLTHAKNAVRMDAEIAIKSVEHLLGTFTAARIRVGRASLRCEECGSYEMVAGVCNHCEWVDGSYQPPVVPEWSEEERELRLSEPCSPSTDIATFMTPQSEW